MKKTSPMYVLGFMIITCALCGIAISSVQFSIKKTLDSNAQLARNRTIASAFNLAVDQQTAEAYEAALTLHVKASTISDDNRQWQLFTNTNVQHDVGFIFKGMGFWDFITGIVVLSSDLSSIQSFEVIEQKETPGLGARIEEAAFKQQFKNYPIDWDKPANKRITFGETTSNNAKIDAITGATQTSMALERILNSELTAFKAAYDKPVTAGSEDPAGR